MSRSVSAPATAVRPTAVTIASVLMLVVAVSNIAFIGFPSDDIPTAVLVIGFLLGIAGLPATLGLWRCRRWAMIATVVISVINFLASAPGIVAGPSTLTVVAATTGTIASAATIVLVLLRDSRASYV
ncbi:MAG TPA: hypothetical protein VF201_02480 [Nitrolancea sp.]